MNVLLKIVVNRWIPNDQKSYLEQPWRFFSRDDEYFQTKKFFFLISNLHVCCGVWRMSIFFFSICNLAVTNKSVQRIIQTKKIFFLLSNLYVCCEMLEGWVFSFRNRVRLHGEKYVQDLILSLPKKQEEEGIFFCFSYFWIYIFISD